MRTLLAYSTLNIQKLVCALIKLLSAMADAMVSKKSLSLHYDNF